MENGSKLVPGDFCRDPVFHCQAIGTIVEPPDYLIVGAGGTGVKTTNPKDNVRIRIEFPTLARHLLKPPYSLNVFSSNFANTETILEIQEYLKDLLVKYKAQNKGHMPSVEELCDEEFDGPDFVLSVSVLRSDID